MAPGDRSTLTATFGFYRRFSDAERARFEAQVAEFLATKELVGDGCEIDAHTKLFIAALACRLAVNLPHDEYGRLMRVVVVDAIDEVHTQGLTGGGMLAAVTFTRDALARAFRDDDDGQNVVYHELAHVLDAADGISDGIPPLLFDPARHDVWREVMPRELARLRAAIDMNIPTALDPQGAENESELFAVATEAFFERPTKMRNAHPELYELFAAFYRQRP